MKKVKQSKKYFAQAAMIAALYVVLTYAFSFCASGPVQLRVAEALTILPIFSPAAIPGLSVGCLLANLLTGGAFWDVLFGSIATLLGAIGTHLLRKHGLFSIVATVLSNTLIVPFVLRLVYSDAWPIWLLMLSVGAGELISCCGLGGLLFLSLKRYAGNLFT